MLTSAALAASPASAAKPKLSLADASVSESAEAAKVAVSLSKKPKRTVRLAYATADGSARSGSDYTASAGRLKLRERKGKIEVPLRPDIDDETDERFELVVAKLERAKLGDGAAKITIVDDDPTPSPPDPPPADPTVSLTTTSVPEGTEGNDVHQVAVALSAASAQPVSVDYITAGDTAAAPADFLVANGSLSFAPGETTKSFDLTTVGDYTDEPDETLEVQFSNPVNAQLPSPHPELAIVDDDPACAPGGDAFGSPFFLGSVRGDTGGDILSRNDEIAPCVDSDWFQFELAEASDSPVDLHAQIVLSTTPNGSPASGDLDLCAQTANDATRTCSTLNAGITEAIDVCVDDPFPSGDNSREIFVEVYGFGNAVNDYTLDITGNTALTAGSKLGLGC